MSMFPIRAAGLTFAPNGREVLAGIDLVLAGEGITIVLGPNGAGKSVLLRVLAGLQPIDGGSLCWGGETRPQAAVSIVFQQPALLRASVRSHVSLALKPLPLGRADAARRVSEVLARVGLARICPLPTWQS